MRQIKHIMGIPISIDVRNPSSAVVTSVAKAYDWLSEVDTRFSPFLPESEVCRFDRGELAVNELSSDMITIIALCDRYERDSGGAFRAWSPSEGFDPCGMVKGWAVQHAAELLMAAGSNNFCVNAGGDVVTYGEPEPGRPWAVGIRHPEIANQVCAILSVRNAAVATSACYERGQHIWDGRTGKPTDELLSLTVVAEDLTTADATATAAFAMGVEGIAWAASRRGCLVFAVDAERQVHHSAEMDDILE